MRHYGKSLEQCLARSVTVFKTQRSCAEVKPRAGYVGVFKDRHGPLQYLLMPTYRYQRYRRSLLLEPATPNFFWLARGLRLRRVKKIRKYDIPG